MQLRDFLNAANALNFIDRQDWMSDDQWRDFSANPIQFLRRANHDVAERIWALVKVSA